MQVIRSLKRALQPAVTDVSVEFMVPGGYEVVQSPQNLPPVFNGEKLVVYGILKAKGSARDGSGKAVLKGMILGKKLEHSVSFQLVPIPGAAPELASIHHLAGKALVKDWESEGRSKESVVKLSIESSVISSHTAFVAIDEENSEPISGAMKTWDIRALEEEADFLYGYAAAPMAMNSAPMMHVETLAMSLDDCFDDEDEEENESIDDLVELEAEGMLVDLCSATEYLPISLPPKPLAGRAQPPMDNLSVLVSTQQANGSWSLSEGLSRLLGKALAELEGGCPVECHGDMVGVWATLLALCQLRRKYSGQQDEWELIAMKAESWLKRQPLPAGVTLSDLKQAAEKTLA